MEHMLESILYILFGLTNVINITSSNDCSCPCSKVGNTWDYLVYANMTAKELVTFLKDETDSLHEVLKIDPKETKLYTNTKISATDNRKSSAVIGLFGGLMIAIPFALCLCSDMCRCSNNKKTKKD